MHQRVYRSRLVIPALQTIEILMFTSIIHNVDLLVLRENLLSVPSS